MWALLFNVCTRASRAHGLTICGLRTYQSHDITGDVGNYVPDQQETSTSSD